MSEPTSGGTAVARRPQQGQSVDPSALITSAKARKFIEPFLPEGTDIQRVAASLMLAFKKDESGALKRCTPESLVTGIARIQQWRLELGVTAYLIPFKNEAVPVVGYQGLVELVYAASKILLDPGVVREGDEFRYVQGLNPVLEHTPRAKKNAPITHAYVIIRAPKQQSTFLVMTTEEIDAIRQQHSKQWKAGPLPAWYAKKTLIRQAGKVLPKTPALQQFYQILEEEDVASPIAGTARVAQDDPASPGADDRGEEQELDDNWIEEQEREPGQEG